MYNGASSDSFGARGNLWASIRSYFDRGGFVNGLNPQIVGRIWYVNANSETDADERAGIGVGSDSNPGNSPSAPFATMDRVLEFVDSYDIVALSGVIREQVTCPVGVHDVTLFGAANQPRQATDGGVPTNGGATWLPPSSPVALTPLIKVIEQGWQIRNIMFGAVQDTSSILLATEETAAVPDASHAIIDGCFFQPGAITGAIGIGDYGGMFHCQITNNLFYALETALKGLNASIRTPNNNLIAYNWFRLNTNAIDWDQNYSIVQGNYFKTNTTKQVDIAGDHNYVIENYFDKDQADITIANGFAAGANSVWRNYSKDTAAQTVGVPS